MIEVVCPNPACGRKLRASESSAGRTARCPVCNTSITIPQAPPPPVGSLGLQQEPPAPAGGPWDAALPGSGPLPAPQAPARRRWAPLAVGALVAIAAAGAAAFFLLRGGSRRKGSFGSPPAIASTYQGPKVELKILMNPAVYTIVESSEDRGEQKITIGRQSQEQSTTSSLRVDGEIDIRPPAPGTGERHITYTCTRVKMDQVQGPIHTSYDSENPDAASSDSSNPAGQMLAAVLGSMVGWKGVQVYSKDGQFLRLEGLEQLLSKMRAAPGGAQMAGMMKKMLEPFLRDTLTRHWGKLLPTGPVGPGDSWKRTIDLDQVPMFGRIGFEFTCWLTDVVESPDGKVAVLLCDGQARLRGRDVDMSGMGIPMAPKMTVDDMTLLLRQTVKFPLAVGLATEVTGDVDVDGSMTMRIVGQTASMELQQTSKFTYALTPKKQGAATK